VTTWFWGPRYDVSWRVVNARHWLPQNRERVYITGLRSDLAAPPMDWSSVLPPFPPEPRDPGSVPGGTLRGILQRPGPPGGSGGTGCGGGSGGGSGCSSGGSSGSGGSSRGGGGPPGGLLAAVPSASASGPLPPGAVPRADLRSGLGEAAEVAAAELTTEQWAVVVAQCAKAAAEGAAKGSTRKAPSGGGGDGVSGRGSGEGSSGPGSSSLSPPVSRPVDKTGDKMTAGEAVTTVGEDAVGPVASVEAASAAAAAVARLARGLQIDGKSPTLTSGYHGCGNFTTKYARNCVRRGHRSRLNAFVLSNPCICARYVFEEFDGSQRGGGPGEPRPRFLTPRECARVMG